MGKKNYLLLLLSLLIFPLQRAIAQQDYQFSQYMLAGQIFNPAYTGSRDVSSFAVMHRQQWVGIDGAPVTSMLALAIPEVGKGIALGLSGVTDAIGPSNMNSFSGDIAYRVRVSQNYYLNLGLKVTGDVFNVDFTKLNAYNPGDYALSRNIQNQFTANIGAGAYLFSDNTFFGISAPRLLSHNYFAKENDTEGMSLIAKRKPHIYATAGREFYITPDLYYTASVMLSAVEAAPLKVELWNKVQFYDSFVAGFAFRINASVTSFAGFNIGEHFLIGYGFDLQSNRLTPYSSGTHEIFLRYDVSKAFRNF